MDTYYSTTESQTNTYGVQKSLNQYFDKKEKQRELKIRQAQDEQEAMPEDDENLDMSDPLYTNRIEKLNTETSLFTDPITGAKFAPRQIYEKIRLINISSKDRVQFICEELPVNPVTKAYTRLVYDDDGNQIVCKYTSDLLNAEYYWNPVECLNNLKVSSLNTCLDAEPFLSKDCRIFMKIPKYPNPNNYTINFNSPFSYIKEISLIAAEIPNPFRTIGEHNNKIIFHIKDCNGKALLFKPDYRGIPFFIMEIAPGIYTLQNLIKEMEKLANEVLDEFGDSGRADLKFKINYDSITEIVSIELIDSGRDNRNGRWVFHWRFWGHCTIPEERTLYRMLGFARPFLRDKDGSDYYASKFDNVFRDNNQCQGLSTTSSKKIARPFSRPNLFPDTFFYLIINNLDMGNDAIYACNPNITINNIFAKIQVIPLCCDTKCAGSSSGSGSFIRNDYLYNTHVSSNKIYLESPLRVLDRMDISFVDAFGDLVDFGKLDHSLTFRIVQYIDYLVDTNFDSTRGI